MISKKLEDALNEQVEEANDRDILDTFKYIDGNAGLLILDKELGKRE